MPYHRFQHVLQDAGLNSQESLLYDLLLRAGQARASELAGRSGLSRTNVYNILKALAGQGLVTVDRSGTRILYAPQHPERLMALIDQRQSALADTRQELQGLMHSMISEFMLGSQRPAAVSFEGRQGILRVYDDLLNDRVPLQSFQDMKKLDEFLVQYNVQFIRERVRRKIRHRLIAPESTRAFLADRPDSPFREVRYLPESLYKWDIDLKITSKKLIITTFRSNIVVGIVIINPDITASMLALFETVWSMAKV